MLSLLEVQRFYRVCKNHRKHHAKRNDQQSGNTQEIMPKA